MGVARAWSRWPTEIISPSLIYSVNDFLSDVGSKKAISIMVLEINVPPHSTFSVYALYIYISQRWQARPGQKKPPPPPLRSRGGGGGGGEAPDPVEQGAKPPVQRSMSFQKHLVNCNVRKKRLTEEV